MDIRQSPPFTVVLNKRSGPYDGDEIQAQIEAIIPSERLEGMLILDAGQDLRDLVKEGLARAREARGCLLLAGGDGTINGALPILLEEYDVPFAVLPLGTFNYFARSHGIDLDPETALHAILRSEPVKLSVASINGEPFVINVSMGFFPRIIDARERHQGRFGRNRSVAVASGVYTALGHQHENRLLLNLDGKQRHIKSPMVSVVFNRHQIELLNLDPSCLDQDKMTVLITRPLSRLGMLGLMMRGALGRLDSADNLEVVCASEVMIGVRRPTVRVAIDGETRVFTAPLRLRVHHEGLRLMLPVTEEAKEVVNG